MRRRSTGAGFPRLARGHGYGARSRARDSESQYGDRAAPVSPSAFGRALRTLARHAGVREEVAVLCTQHAAYEVRSDAGLGRNAGRSARGDAGSAVGGGGHPDAGPVLAAFTQAPADYPLRPS